MKKRRYDLEYKNYHSKPEQKKNRAMRNAALRKIKEKGLAVKGKDVDHKDGNPRNNALSNLRVISQSQNRSFPRTKTGRKKKV